MARFRHSGTPDNSEAGRRHRQQSESRQYASTHTEMPPAGKDLSGSVYGARYMANVGKAGLARQQRQMGETGRSEAATADATSGLSQHIGGRATRDLGGPRTPPHK